MDMHAFEKELSQAVSLGVCLPLQFQALLLLYLEIEFNFDG